MKHWISALIVSLLVLLLGTTAACADDLQVETAPGKFTVDFTMADSHFAVVRFSTQDETGWFTLYSEDGHFSGEGTLQCSYQPCKLTVKTQNIELKDRDKVRVDYPGTPMPEGQALPFAEKRRGVRDLVLTPVDGGVAYHFTAEGHGSVTLKYRTVRETGSVILYPDEAYVYDGVLSLPYTYNQSNVYITLVSGKNRTKLAEEKTTRGYTLEQKVFEPAQDGRLKGVVICVDAGHQNVPGGHAEPLGPGLSGMGSTIGGMAEGTVTNRRESIVMLECAYILRDELLRQGATVIMTRETEAIRISNLDRVGAANDGGAHIMFRLHGDLNSDPKLRGFSVIYPFHSSYAQEVADHETYGQYATLIRDALAEKAAEGRGVHPRISTSDSYVGNNWAKMPCFLVELGFMSNVQDDVLLSIPEHQQQLAEALAEGSYRLAIELGVLQPEQ